MFPLRKQPFGRLIHSLRKNENIPIQESTELLSTYPDHYLKWGLELVFHKKNCKRMFSVIFIVSSFQCNKTDLHVSLPTMFSAVTIQLSYNTRRILSSRVVIDIFLQVGACKFHLEVLFNSISQCCLWWNGK